MSIKLHVFPSSPRAFKVMGTANHLGVAFDPVLVDFSKGTNRTPGSWGLIPTCACLCLKTNALLVKEGPFRLTRNPMYLNLSTFTLGIVLGMGSLPMFFVPFSRPSVSFTSRSRKPRCAASSARRSTPTPARSAAGFESREPAISRP